MKGFKYWAIQVAFFLFYAVIVYNFTIQNLWLSIFMAVLMVSAFSSSNKLGMVFKTKEKSTYGDRFSPHEIFASILVFFGAFQPFSGCFSRCSWPLGQLQADLSRGPL